MRILIFAACIVLFASRTPQAYAPPPEGPLARIDVGMGEQDVMHLLGPPSDTVAYPTPKNLIPFYMGSDSSEIVYYYANVGRVVFAAGPFRPRPRVIRIEDDPAEPGFARRRGVVMGYAPRPMPPR